MPIPNDKLAPNLAQARHPRVPGTCAPTSRMSFFNMEDPVVGGYTPAKVALRRAIQLALRHRPRDPGSSGAARRSRRRRRCRRDLRLRRRLRTENSTYDVARAKALLDIYGYVDRNGDGWREKPDGSPLVLVMSSEPDQIYRQYNENWQKEHGTRIGIRMVFEDARNGRST